MIDWPSRRGPIIRICTLLLSALLALAGPAQAQPDTGAHRLLEQAVAADGGEPWLIPSTLYLAGIAVFCAPDSAQPRSTADDYRMWRAMNPDRTTAHGADGKVRITAKSEAS